MLTVFNKAEMMALLFSNGPKTQRPMCEQAKKIGECASTIFERALQEGPENDAANLRSLQQILSTAEQLNRATTQPKSRPR